MLALLAALVPIIGSLYAGASFFHEQRSLLREKQIREHGSNLVEQRRPAAEARAERWRGKESKWYERTTRELRDLENVLLSAHGVERSVPTIRQFTIEISMSGMLVSSNEYRRQMVLLGSASTGVVLLALHALL